MDDQLGFPDVFHALSEWARMSPHGVRVGGARGGFDHIQLHARPDPRGPQVQLTFQPRLVDGRPVITVSRSPTPTAEQRSEDDCARAVCLSVPEDEETRLLGRNPAATCEACGTLGTIGRAVRTDPSGAATETHRFCAGCWPEQSARYRARWQEEDRRRSDDFLRGRSRTVGAGPGMWFQAATWHGALDVVRQIERLMIAPIPPAAQDLAPLAAQIREGLGKLEGEMPFEVESFLQRYGAPAS